MSIRHYTRLTNAFSRKLENHAVAVLCYFSYNFIHRTANDACHGRWSMTNWLWEVSDLISLLEASERGLERAA
jgi:hypothetical protein